MDDTRPEAVDPDEAAAKRIRESLDETLFVEAGAGTGKTWALVERVVSLVLGGRTIDRIAAITFTEKAAAELKDRVRQGLEDRLRDHPETSDLVKPALEALDRAQISTIHSFCQDLLYLFAAEAGVDPSFEVQDEIKASRRFNDRWRSFVEGLSADEAAAAVIDRVLGLGMFPGDLEALAQGLTARAELVSVLAPSLPAADAPDWRALPAYRDSLDGLVSRSVPETDQLRMRIETMASVIGELLRNPAEREVVLASATGVMGWTFGRCGNAATWGGTLTAARNACAEVSDGLKQLLATCRSEALRDLIPLIVRFVEEDAVTRGRDGLMTFDDLILRVRDLLRFNAQAVRALRDRFDALLIDEFQDTDPLQVDIAMAFARDPGTGKIEPGRLFLVGDPKQSIYRFRRADMSVYSDTGATLESAGAERPQLRRNRRSRRAVIDWVNLVFQRMIGTGDRPKLQPEYQEILHHRENEDIEGPGVACFGGEIADGSNARQVRVMEGRDVAGHCRTAVEGKWQVVDKRSNAVRQASYRDIAILIPARTSLTSLERSLAEAGVPYRVEGGSLIYRTQEVRDLITCLTAIDDPADEVAIVGALRSPAFACSDVDIARFVAGNGKINYLRGDPASPDGPVAQALLTLRRYHERRHGQSLAALVEEFVTECGLVEAGILDQGDRNSFRRMRYVVEQARAFEAKGPESLRALVQWLEGCAQQAMLDHEGAGLDDDEDAVRVLTIHGAKGLEFPIVILAGMGSAPYSRPGNYLVDRSDESVAIQVGTKGNNRRFTLGDVEHLEQAEKEHCDAEFVRMLYVGATRARDHLLFSLYRTQRATKAAAVQLEAAGAREAAAALRPAAPVDRGARRPFEGVQVDEPAAGTPEEMDERRSELVASSRKQTYTSATRLGRTEDKDAGEDDTEPWSRGRAGTRLGRAVHAAVQSLSLDADHESVEAFSRAQAVAEAIPERAPEVARLVHAALQSAAAQRARSAQRALREVPFAVPVDGVIVEGFVDMLIETPEGLEIVDWKTDRVSAGDVDSRLADYRLQAGLYVLGIERATERQVRRVTYVFVSAGREASPGEPAELAESALARVVAGQTG